MEYMLMPLRRYADFSGRSRRKEYWMYALLNIIVYAIAVLLMLTDGNGGDMAEMSDPSGLGYIGILILFIWCLANVVPSIAVTVRRFHDQDKSGWLCLLGLFPYVGGIILFVFMVIDGTSGSNQYGPSPKSSREDDIATFS